MAKKQSKEILEVMLNNVRGKQLSPNDKERLDAVAESLDNGKAPNSRKIVITFGDSSVFTHSDQAAILMAINNLLTNDLHLVVNKLAFVEDDGANSDSSSKSDDSANSDSSSNSADSINH